MDPMSVCLHFIFVVIELLKFDVIMNMQLPSGGFGSSLLAMDERTYQLIGDDYPGNRAEDVKNPGLGWMIGFLFVVSFLGLFSLVPLRKVASTVIFIINTNSVSISAYNCKMLIQMLKISLD